MIKKLIIISGFLLFLFVFSSLTFSQQNISVEKINIFEVDVTINKNGTIDVKEKIEYDFGAEYKHGIIRQIDLFKTNQDGKKYILDYNVHNVTDEKGVSYDFETNLDKKSGFYIIKIGDPNKTIKGLNTYVISYNVTGALTYFSDHDELYWNATGDKWTIPVLESISKISLPLTVKNNEINSVCYTGIYGSKESDCSISSESNIISITSNNELKSNEGLSFVIGFPKNNVAVIEPRLYTPFWESIFGKMLKFFLISVLVVAIILWYVFYPIYIIYRWFRHGRDPSALIGKVSAWFDPPKSKKGRSLTPAETGSIIDEKVHLRDISSAIVDLARRGYLKIKEKKKKDFYFIKRKKYEGDKKLLLFEKELLQGIFSSSKNVRLKDKKLYSTISTVKEEIYNQLVNDGFFPKNPEKIRNFYILISILGLVTVNIPLALISAIFGRIMPRKTLDGVNASNVAHSLKSFLISQDRQLEFQAKNQMFFEKLLPYAVAFGVEKVWARRFQDINMKEPDWYSGQSTTFNSIIFANSLNSSFKSVATSATPTTSSSGFSSGSSSGGGFSGGGGGGGGGGSW